jgi:hypothetical protein
MALCDYATWSMASIVFASAGATSARQLSPGQIALLGNCENRLPLTQEQYTVSSVPEAVTPASKRLPPDLKESGRTSVTERFGRNAKEYLHADEDLRG